jgi:hypothetical protein
MNSSRQTLSELKRKRTLLNDLLMKSKTLAEANNIERELWAVRTAIGLFKSDSSNEVVQRRSSSYSLSAEI